MLVDNWIWCWLRRVNIHDEVNTIKVCAGSTVCAAVNIKVRGCSTFYCYMTLLAGVSCNSCTRHNHAIIIISNREATYAILAIVIVSKSSNS